SRESLPGSNYSACTVVAAECPRQGAGVSDIFVEVVTPSGRGGNLSARTLAPESFDTRGGELASGLAPVAERFRRRIDDLGRAGEHRRAGCQVGAGSTAVRFGFAGRDRDRHCQGRRGHHVYRDADLVGRSARGGGMTLAVARLEAVWTPRQAPGRQAGGGSQ